MEPSPRAIKFVPEIFLSNYGWRHKKAGIEYPVNEMSFRQTIHGQSRSDRGFMVQIDRKEHRVEISFDYRAVDSRHGKWLEKVKENIGTAELSPKPYWGFEDLKNKAGTKMLNSFFVQAEVKKERGNEYYKYEKIKMLQNFDFERFLWALENAKILIDFDARTGHNHGTKFRMKQDCWPLLYEKITDIL
jgi:hypothetical protein